MIKSALYEGWVMHRRLSPKHHRFKYRVFAMLLELDELAVLDRKLAFFKYNRWGLFSFQDRDHGDGRPLHVWLNDVLALNGIAATGKRRVLCYPRILGFVFNPISVWFCDDAQDRLKAIIYEVHNTYDERHAYVLPVDADTGLVRHGCAKNFYVSPFLSRDCRYNFRIRRPDRDVAIVIQEEEAGRPILNASFAGERRTLDNHMLGKMFLRYPLMTLKVVLAIHFEAVRLMLKGIRRHPHRPKALYAPAE
jgi:DUF1365 family protein